MPPQTPTLLRKARALVLQGWTQGHGAKTHDGRPTMTHLTEATSFCTIGAAMRVFTRGNYRYPVYAAATDLLCRGAGVSGFPELTVWNDHPDRTQADVLDLYTRAIARAKEETQ